MTEFLSEDLIIEIFCRLPVSILVGFKCLSKMWNALISNVCLPRISRERSLPLSGFLFPAGSHPDKKERYMDYLSYSDDNHNAVVGDKFVESYSSLLPSEYSPYNVLDCCNGLILLVSEAVCRYYLCNPATKQCVSIPKSRLHDKVLDASLAFCPCESIHYKVIRFMYSINYSASIPPELDIFSSESGKWTRHRIFVEPPSAYGVPWMKSSVYLGGILYKLSSSKHLLRMDLRAIADIKPLIVEAIELPYMEKTDAHGFIGVSKGVLHYSNHDHTKIIISQFDFQCKTGRFWMFKHCIYIKNLATKDPAAADLLWHRYSCWFKPYAIHPTSDVIFIGIPDKLFSYHLETQKLKLLCKRPKEGKIVWGQLFVYPYMRCFIILKDFSRTQCKSSELELILKGMRDLKFKTGHDDAEEDIGVNKALEAA